MFKIVSLEDTIRIPPNKFGEDIDTVGHEQLKMKYEGVVSNAVGYIIAVTNIEVNPLGKIIPGDGATFHRAKFSLLTFFPQLQEVIRERWLK